MNTKTDYTNAIATLTAQVAALKKNHWPYPLKITEQILKRLQRRTDKKRGVATTSPVVAPKPSEKKAKANKKKRDKTKAE